MLFSGIPNCHYFVSFHHRKSNCSAGSGSHRVMTDRDVNILVKYFSEEEEEEVHTLQRSIGSN